MSGIYHYTVKVALLPATWHVEHRLYFLSGASGTFQRLETLQRAEKVSFYFLCMSRIWNFFAPHHQNTFFFSFNLVISKVHLDSFFSGYSVPGKWLENGSAHTSTQKATKLLAF